MKHRVVLLFVLLSILFMFQGISTAATLPEGADVVAPYTGSEIKFLDLEIPEPFQNVKFGSSWDVKYCTADHFNSMQAGCTTLDYDQTVNNRDEVKGINKGYYIVYANNSTCVFAIDDVKTRVIVVPDEKSKYYGDKEPPHTYTLKSESGTPLTGKLDISGELLRVVSESQENGEAVGTYGYSISYLKLSEAHAAKYELVLDETVKFTIKPLEVKIEWGKNYFPYDGNSHAPEATVSNLVKGDDCVVTVEGEQTEAIPASDVYIATATGLTGADSSNYVLPVPAPTWRFRINPVKLTLTWNTEVTEFPYNGEEQRPEFTLTGCVGDDVEGDSVCKAEFINENLTVTGNKDAGTSYLAKASLNEGVTNYTLSETAPFEYTITKKPITIIWEGYEEKQDRIKKPYDGTAQHLTAVIKEGDIVERDSCVITISKTATDVSDGQVRARADFSKKSGTYDSCLKNYMITDENRFQYFEITPFEAQVTWSNTEVFYNGTEQKPSASYEDVNGNTKNVEPIMTVPVVSVNAGDYTASAESDDPNYRFSEATASHVFTITPKTINVTWDTNTFVYNGDIRRPEPSIADLETVDADRCVIVAKGGETNASEMAYTATAQWAKVSDVSCASNYTLENTTHEYYITPKDLTLTWAENVDHEYDGEAYFPEFTLTGCVGTDGDSDGICTAEFIKEYVNTTDASVNVGTYMATVSMGENQPNYKLTGETDTSFAITPAQVNEILWSEDDPFTYNASAQAPKAQYRDVKGELVDAIVKIKEQDQAINAGEYVALAETGSDNYKFTDSAITEKTFEIQKDALTVIPVSPLSKRYGEYDPEFKYKIINRNGDNVQGLVEYPGSMLTVDYKNEEPKANHTYNFSLEKMFLQDRFDANYKLVLAETPKFQVLDGENAITEFPESLNVTYNGDDQVVISPAKAKFGTVLYSWDQETWTEDLPKWKNAGDTDTFWYKVDGGENHEDIAPTSLYATVLPATLTVTPDSKTKVYGDTDPELTYEVSGNVEGEIPVFTGVLKRVTGEDAGTYKIGKGSLKLESNVDVNKNYVYEPTTGLSQNVLFTITPLIAVIDWDQTTISFPYDGTEHIPTAVVNNLVEGDVCDVTVKGAQKNVGEYFATATGLSNPNYILPEGVVETEFVITPAVLTVTPADGQFKVWDGNAPAEIDYYVDGICGDDKPAFTGALTIGDVYDAGEYPIQKGTLSLDDPNYSADFTFTEGVIYTIKKAPSSITTAPAKVKDLKYNGEPHTLITAGAADGGEIWYRLTGVNDSYSTELPQATDANEKYTVHYYVKGDKNHEDLGSEENPYNLVYVGIAPAEVTVKADDITITYGDPEPTLTATVTGLQGQDTEDLIVYELKREEGSNADTYVITASGEEEQGNYVVSFESGTLTINKAQSAFAAEPKGIAGLIYNGQPQTLIEDGQTNDGEIQYRLVGGSGYSTELPQATDANEKYCVQYYIKGDENHEDLGSAASPYNLVYVPIAQADVTVAAEDKTIIYGEPEPKLTAKVEGLKGEDSEDLIEYTISRESGDNVGEYVITPAGEKSQGNYSVSFVPGKLTIGKASVTVKVVGREVTEDYNGKVHSTMYDMFITSDPTNKYVLEYVKFVGTAWRIDETNADEYVLELKPADFENTNGNYEVTFETTNGKLTINKAEATIIADDKTKVYGENDPELTAQVVGLYGDDTVSYMLTRAEGEDVGSYEITASGEENQGNYHVNFINGKLTISKAQPSIITEPKAISGLIYNGQPQDIVEPGTADGGTIMYFFKGGEKSATPPQGTDAGEYSIYYYVQGDKNHEDLIDKNNTEDPYRYRGVKAAIKPAEVTVIADNKEKTYGEEDPVFTATVNGTFGSDTVAYTFSREGGEDVDSYEITVTGEENQGNYHVNFVGGTLTINKAMPTITVEPKAKEGLVYNGQPQNLVEPGTADGGTIMYFFKGGEKSATPPQGTDAGEYRVYYYVQGDKNHSDLIDENNTEDPYRYHGVKATIGQAEVTVTADDKEKTYGESDPVFTATVEGTFGSDTVAYTFSRESGEDVGEYAINVTGEKSQGNYHVTFVPGKLTINKAKPTITAEPKAISGLIYNGQPQDIVEPGTADGGTIMYFFKGGEKSATPPQGTDAGEYSIYYYVQGDKNHSDLIDENNTEDPYRYHGVKATIGQAEVTVTADDKEKTYGESDPVFTATVEGTFGSDTVAYTFSRESGEDVGEYAINVTGEKSQGNYHVTFVPGKLTINKAKPTITAEPKAISGLIYNGQPQDIVEPGTADGGTIMYFFKGGEKSPTPPQGTDAGEYRVYYYVQGDSNHYDLIDENNTDDPYRYNGVKVTIAQKEVTVTADDKTKRYGEQDPEFTATVTGTIGDDTVTYKLSREAGENVGEYAITPEGEVSQGNYTVIYVPGKLTIEKVPASIVTPPSALTPAPIYNGEEQVLIDGGVANGGVIWFRIQGESEYKGAWDLPKGKDAGEYVIEYFVIGDDNHTNYGSADEPFTMTAAIAPKPVHIIWGNTELTYNGEPQVPVAYVPDEEIENGDTVKVIYSDDSRKTDAGEGYIATVIGLDNSNYTLAGDAQTETKFKILPAKLVECNDTTADVCDYTAPKEIDDLFYNGKPQDLIIAGECREGLSCKFFYAKDEESFIAAKEVSEDDYSEDIPQGTDAGTYTIYWRIISDANHIPVSGTLYPEISRTSLNTNTRIDVMPKEPYKFPFYYDGTPKEVTFTVVNNNNGEILENGVDYEVVLADLSGIKAGVYSIVINGLGGYEGTKTATWRIESVDEPAPFELHPLNGFWDRETNCSAFGCGQQLPATGFPTRFRMPLSVRPDGLKYEDLGMRLQIPALEVSVDLVGVPRIGRDWAIEWLGADAGILSGTSEPGRGYTMIAGHNHLNESEMGPFRNIGSLKQYDTIYITLENGMNLPFSVYANELLRPDDYEAIAKIALEDPNSLVLVTCENESKDGGYLNRRVVFAKPF